ncbi:MAG: helix-turn-helix domain-containing protein [Lachnospiraceae bacterium]|nr:helix-turn-helix domain-containing protein [Lachnospiraceae bacterium]
MNTTLKKIMDLLEERKWTIYRLAKESGIPYSSLNSLFQKNNQPTISTLEKICSGFHITMCEFFSDDTPYREDMVEYTREELDIIEAYRNLNRTNKKIFEGILQVLQNN